MNLREKPIAVLGATGYIGGRIAPRLLDAGWKVRAVVRSAYKLRSRPWGAHPGPEVVEADVQDRAVPPAPPAPPFPPTPPLPPLPPFWPPPLPVP